MKIAPIDSDILFEFSDHVTSRGFFREKTSGGIILAQTDVTSAKLTADNARLITVLSVGPKCKEVTPGMVVVVTPLKWSPQFEVNGKSVWKTTEEHILGIIE